MLRSLPFGRAVFKKDTGKVKIKSEDIEKDIFAFFVGQKAQAIIRSARGCRLYISDGCVPP
jgi:hypothetical protein